MSDELASLELARSLHAQENGFRRRKRTEDVDKFPTEADIYTSHKTDIHPAKSRRPPAVITKAKVVLKGSEESEQEMSRSPPTSPLSLMSVDPEEEDRGERIFCQGCGTLFHPKMLSENHYNCSPCVLLYSLSASSVRSPSVHFQASPAHRCKDKHCGLTFLFEDSLRAHQRKVHGSS